MKTTDGRSGAWAHIFSGTQLAVSVLLGVFGGLWLDQRFGTGPWLMLLCSLIGIAAGLYHFIAEMTRSQAPLASSQGKPVQDDRR